MKINDDLEEVLLFKNNYYSIWYSDKKISFRNKSDNIIIEDLYFNTDRVLKDNPINGVYGLNYKGKKVPSLIHMDLKSQYVINNNLNGLTQNQWC